VFQASADLCSKPLTHLVRYLIKPAKTELAKVRAIFRWIAAQNLANLTSAGSTNDPPETPLDYLIAMKNNTTNDHTLMQDMCRSINVFAALFVPVKDVNSAQNLKDYYISNSIFFLIWRKVGNTSRSPSVSKCIFVRLIK